jgi:hypothetical protein
MKFRTFAMIGVAVALAPNGALAATDQGSNHNSAAVQVAAASASSVAQPATAQQAPAQPVASHSVRQAGMSKPVKVYWFLSGR